MRKWPGQNLALVLSIKGEKHDCKSKEALLVKTMGAEHACVSLAVYTRQDRFHMGI